LILPEIPNSAMMEKIARTEINVLAMGIAPIPATVFLAMNTGNSHRVIAIACCKYAETA
jgi:hypothetical protein